MADISTFEEGKECLSSWCGFCWYNLKWLYKGEQNKIDMKLIKQLVQENICVIAEGKFIHLNKQDKLKSWVLQELSLVVQLHDHKKLLKDLSMHE